MLNVALEGTVKKRNYIHIRKLHEREPLEVYGGAAALPSLIKVNEVMTGAAHSGTLFPTELKMTTGSVQTSLY